MDDSSALPEGEFQKLFISTLYHDPDSTTSFLSHLKPEYFTAKPAQYLVKFLCEFWEKYKTVPPPDVVSVQIGLDLESGKVSEAEAYDVITVYDSIHKAAEDPRDRAKIPYIRDQASIWLQRSAIIGAVNQSRDDILSGRNEVNYAKRFQEAMQVGEQAFSNDALFGIQDRELYSLETQEELGGVIGTGFTELDERISGGIRPGEIGVFMAATGKGKSHALAFTGRNAVQAGHKVLHVTLEMSKTSVWARYVSGMIGIPNNEVRIRQEEVLQALNLRMELYPGDFAIVRYPTRSATVNTLRALVAQLNHTKKFVPDVLILDYADLLMPVTGRREAPTHEAQGIVYEELRGFAIENNLVVWTATQTNRPAHTSRTAPDLDMVGDSYAKTRVADLIISISSDNGDRGRNQETLAREEEGRFLTRTLLPVKVRNGPSHRKLTVVMDAALSTFVEAAPVIPTLDPVPLGGFVGVHSPPTRVVPEEGDNELDA